MALSVPIVIFLNFLLVSSVCNIHFALTACHFVADDYVGNQPITWKEYYAEYLLK